jgi:hypothetical protein
MQGGFGIEAATRISMSDSMRRVVRATLWGAVALLLALIIRSWTAPRGGTDTLETLRIVDGAKDQYALAQPDPPANESR